MSINGVQVDLPSKEYNSQMTNWSTGTVLAVVLIWLKKEKKWIVKQEKEAAQCDTE